MPKSEKTYYINIFFYPFCLTKKNEKLKKNFKPFGAILLEVKLRTSGWSIQTTSASLFYISERSCLPLISEILRKILETNLLEITPQPIVWFAIFYLPDTRKNNTLLFSMNGIGHNFLWPIQAEIHRLISRRAKTA